MVFLLLPSVRIQALILILATFGIRTNEVVNLPIGAHFTGVDESRRTPSEVLPVVRVDADFTVVVILAIGAPNCLKVEHIEVHINFVLFDQLN